MDEEDGCHKLEDTCTQNRRLEDGSEGGQGATGTVEPWSSSSSSSSGSSSSSSSRTNEEVRQLYGELDIVTEIKERKIEMAGTCGEDE